MSEMSGQDKDEREFFWGNSLQAERWAIRVDELALNARKNRMRAFEVRGCPDAAAMYLELSRSQYNAVRKMMREGLLGAQNHARAGVAAGAADAVVAPGGCGGEGAAAPGCTSTGGRV